MNSDPQPGDANYTPDFIIVGSGAGGGPLAGRLAEQGFKVLVIEAGADHARVPYTVTGADTRPPESPQDKEKRLEALEISQVPSLHGVSTEHPELSWQFFVKHYEDANLLPNPDLREPSDPKFYPNPTKLGPNGQPQAEADPTRHGIFYPRTAALGGCTVHNAMITVCGPDSDWDDLADFLHDPSWSGSNMRKYFQRLEHNEYIGAPDTIPTKRWGQIWHDLRWLFDLPWRWVRSPDYTAGRHGFRGWLHTSVADISLGLHDKQLIKMLKAALWKTILSGIDNGWTLVRRFFQGRIAEALDPNHARTQADSPEGAMLVPIAVCGKGTNIQQCAETPFVQRGRRSSPREFLLEVKAKHPENLVIWTECLVTKVLFDAGADSGGKPRAVGIEFLKGSKLYRAHPDAKDPEKRDPVRVFTAQDSGEVILCGGTFNTPQLLMLSGIGDEALMAKIPAKAGEAKPESDSALCVLHGRDGTPLPGNRRIHRKGVGLNLQDRYEVTVISEMKEDFSLLNGALFEFPAPGQQPDPALAEWRKTGTGLYTSNGAVLSILKRSNPHLPQPDLFIFGVPLPFEGYTPGYSKVGKIHNRFTWAILKGQTRNHDGTVRLRSADPLDTPEINFHYFNETSKPGRANEDPDLLALVEGVKYVRGIADLAHFKVRGEAHPGRSQVEVSNDAQIKDWIRREAWGHHACGTCRMGPDGDPEAVLDTHFRVRDVDGLRVVDASIFPKIPGYFIVTNIYMASEKAAEVIGDDARKARAERKAAGAAASVSQPVPEWETDLLPDSPAYPRGLRAAEVKALRERRAHVEPADKEAPEKDRNPVITVQGKTEERPVGEWADDVTGLGLSGGGLRSATLNLGILQAMAKGKALRLVDFLSTVSGGGYIGSFLGRYFDRLRDPLLGKPQLSPPAPDLVEAELINPDSVYIRWLRKHANYIAPTGEGDSRVILAVFLRNLLTMHFVVGTLLFALFGIANLVRYGLFDPTTAGLGLVTVGKGDLPMGHLLQAVLGPFFSPWFVLFELVVLFFALPRMVGYWLASQDRHGSFQWPPLFLLFVIGGTLLYAGVYDGLSLPPIFLGVALFSSLLQVECAWRQGAVREAAVGTGGVEMQRLRTRNILTNDLGLSLALAGGALVFAIIDTIGHGLQQWLVENNVTYAKAFAGFVAVLGGLGPVARFAAGFFTGEKKGGGPPSSLVKKLKSEVMAGLLAAVLFSVPLIFYSFASHAVFQGGSELAAGFAATLFALVISLVLTSKKAITVVNRSSIAQTYAARLARAYLGATNEDRHRPTGSNVTEVIGGDDVAAIPEYRPHEVGGPLHVINVTVNQTVDFTSQRGNRDRKGENMAVSSIGLSVGERYHALWGAVPRCPLGQVRKQPFPLKPVGQIQEHPLVDEAGNAAHAAEMLSLRQWIGLSGAAISAGRGATTKVGTALLLGMANLRTGYWWDSSIAEAAREGFPYLSFLRRFLYLLPRFFRTQSLFLAEWVARFPGPWERYWFIADGGFFENLAGYELVRRRVPRIIICDGAADPTYQFDELANLIRKARIDFDACIEPFTAAEVDGLFNAKSKTRIPGADPSLQEIIGTLDEMRPVLDDEGKPVERSKKHAALFWVHYQCADLKSPAPRRSVLLYIKATLTGDEDPATRYYADTHLDFPHESTGDQFFDEPQWESYRKLGEHMATPLFKDPQWFQAIPLASSLQL